MLNMKTYTIRALDGTELRAQFSDAEAARRGLTGAKATRSAADPEPGKAAETVETVRVAEDDAVDDVEDVTEAPKAAKSTTSRSKAAQLNVRPGAARRAK